LQIISFHDGIPNNDSFIVTRRPIKQTEKENSPSSFFSLEKSCFSPERPAAVR
jgi:hypothetical protein